MFDKLVIVGDSFCSERYKPTDWPVFLANKLDVPLYGVGYGGRPWWTIRRWLLENNFILDKQTLVIVCHTNFSRLPSILDFPINPGLIRADVNSDKSDIKHLDPSGKLHTLVKDFYQSDLYVPEFYKWAKASWINELNVMSDNFYKLIHINCFDDYDHVPTHNSCSIQISKDLSSLVKASQKELIPHTGDPSQGHFGPDTRSNHFSEHNNIKLAEGIAKIIIESKYEIINYLNNVTEWDFTPVKFTPAVPPTKWKMPWQ
jgi:hypothetical protein